MAKSETTVTTVDTTLPTAESVTVKSPKTLEIQFSEPGINFPTTAQVTDKVKIDGINAYLSNVDASKLNTEGKVTITLGTALTVGEHKVKISGLADAANLPVAEKEFTVNVVADTTIPTIESVTATSKDKVTVKFNKPVDASTVTAGTGTNGTIKVFEGNNPVAIGAATSHIETKDNQTFEITLTGTLGLASLVDASVKVKGVKDAYGNEVKEEQTFAFTATDDKVAPTVSNVKVNNDNTIEVTFSEDVSFSNSGVELLDKDGKKLSNAINVAAKTIDNKPSKKVYTVSVTGGTNLSGAHSLKFVKDVTKDQSVRGNALAETTQAISLNDKVAPKVESAVFVNEDSVSNTTINSDGDFKDSKVTIYFNEAMDPATLTNAANYLLGGKPLADIKGASLAASSDNKSVTITINRTASEDQYVFTANTNNELRIIAVKDAAGNTLDSTQVNQAITLAAFTATDELTNIIDNTKVEVIAKNQIKVYAKQGVTLESIDPNKVKFAKAGNVHNDLQVTGVALASDKKSAVLTLNNNVGADAKLGADALTLYADANAFVTTTGVKSQELVIGSGLTVVDKVRATVQPVDGKFEVVGDTVTVKFDEALAASTVTTSLVVKDSQGNQLTPSEYTATAKTNGEIDVKITKAGFNDKVTIALSNNVTITDSSSPANFVNDFAAIESKEAVTTAIGITFSATAAMTPAGVTGVKQQETATVTLDTAAVGTIHAIVTAAGMNGSPKTVEVPVLASDDNADKIATKVRAALAADADVSAFFDVSGTGAAVILTAKEAKANDVTMNLNLDKNATTIITDAATSVNTMAGVLAVRGKASTTVATGSANNGTIKVTVSENATAVQTVTVSVANGDTVAQVATKVANELSSNAVVSGKYTVTTSGAAVVLEQKAGQEAPVTVTLTTP